MSDLLPARVQHAHRPPDVILAAVRENIVRLKSKMGEAQEVAAILDTDLVEIWERQLYRTAWGYTNFKLFCQEQLGISPGSVRARVQKVYRSYELVTAENTSAPKTTGSQLRRHAGAAPRPPSLRQRAPLPPPPPATGASDPVSGSVSTPEPSEASPGPAGSEPGEPEPAADPMIGWLCHVLLGTDPEVVVAKAREDQVVVVMEWVERLLLAGKRLGFCEHHPDARSADGRYCTACERQVRR